MFLLFLAVLLIVYAYFKLSFKYWKERNVPFIPPSIPFGNGHNVFAKKVSRAEEMQDFYNYFKSNGYKHGGAYVLTLPLYFPIDTNIIKHVLQNDFDHFNEKGIYLNEKDQPMSAHLFNIGGERWKVLRQKLTPTFTTGKMKLMLGTILECGTNLKEELLNLESTKSDVEIKEIAARFTTDVIGSCAFGITCNSFKYPDADFRKYGRKIFIPTKKREIRRLFSTAFPNLAKKLHITTIPKDVEDFFSNSVKEVIAYREESNIQRNDFLQLLMNINKTEEYKSNKITINEMIGQAFLFFLAGFETSSTTINYCMFELALNQKIQNKAREEIFTVLKKYKNEITYEGIMEMHYLKQVIDETLRKYPPAPTLNRQCSKNYKVPGTDVILEKGTSVVISTFGLHRDPEYFPNPDKFDPDRFSKENIGNIKPFTYMPFGDGPRVCIGLRFGIMQTKVGLITLLKDYRYTLSKKTNPNITFDQGFILSAKEDILLNIEKVN